VAAAVRWARLARIRTGGRSYVTLGQGPNGNCGKRCATRFASVESGKGHRIIKGGYRVGRRPGARKSCGDSTVLRQYPALSSLRRPPRGNAADYFGVSRENRSAGPILEITSVVRQRQLLVSLASRVREAVMSARSIPTFLFPLALLLTGCQPEIGPLSEEDVVVIRETAVAYHEAAVAKDWDAVAEFYTEDAMIMPPNQPVVQGRAAIAGWYASFPPVTEVELRIVEIDGRGDLAYARGTYVLTIAVEGVSEPITDRGKNLAIWRKQVDGSWQMAIDTFNSDVPLQQEH